MGRSVLKTREEWFNDLPEPQRTMAINNTKPRKLKEKVMSFLTALDGGFIWTHTTEGQPFWEEIYLTHRYGKEGEVINPKAKV